MAEPLDDIGLDRRIGALVRLFAAPALAERIDGRDSPDRLEAALDEIRRLALNRMTGPRKPAAGGV